MRDRRTALIVTTWWGVLLSAATCRAQETATDDVVQAVLARAEAVFSGEIEFRRQITQLIRTRRRTEDKVVEDSVAVLRYFESSWSLRYPNNFNSGLVSHGDRSLQYAVARQPDGTRSGSVDIGPPRAIDDRRRYPWPPYFAGTFWFRRTTEYLRRHAQDVRRLPAEEIDGCMCEVLEWTADVPRELTGAETQEMEKQGAVLRVYAAPAYGYALPLVEIRTPDGLLQDRFKASGFREAAAGIFVPSEVVMTSYEPGDSPSWEFRYTIQTCRRVNELFTDEDFAIDIPDGTSIEEPLTGIVFRAGLEDPQQIVEGLSRSAAPPRRQLHQATLTGLGVGAAVSFIAGLRLWLLRKARATAPSNTD